MNETTLSKSAQSAEAIASAVILDHLLKDAYVADNLPEHLEKLELIATIVMASVQPADA